MLADKKYPLSLRKRILFSAIPALVLLLLAYSVYFFQRTNELYRFLKKHEKGFEEKTYTYDPVLGFAPVPGFEGRERIGFAPEVPIKFDREGFRVPLNEASAPLRTRPLVLALGCSYTFGDLVSAEKTYPYLVARRLNGTPLNAAVPAYGLAQMLLLARKLIPEYKPDYVLIQFSSWLVDRSRSPFPPCKYGQRPSPYFVDSADRKPILHPPVFATKVFSLPISSYRHTKRGKADYLSFVSRVALPLYLYDDLNIVIYNLKLFLGLIPHPARDREQIASTAYEEIAELCRANHSKMTVVILHHPTEREPTVAEILAIRNIKNALVVDTGPTFINQLSEKNTKSYYAAYGFTAGSPPHAVDDHPNEHAHQIIADEIIKAMRRENFAGGD